MHLSIIILRLAYTGNELRISHLKRFNLKETIICEQTNDDIKVNSGWSEMLSHQVAMRVAVVVVAVEGAASRQEDYNDDDVGGGGDIYIMMSVYVFVTKNHHFLLGVSCNHLNPP